MDDVVVGRVLRRVRRRQRLTQATVARAAGVSQQFVSHLEVGRIERTELWRARAVARVLGVTLGIDARWRGAQLGRLLDEAHASLVDHVVGDLRGRSYSVVIEYTFNHFGERGSVDVVAWRAAEAALVVVEVKTSIVDVQDLVATLDRKARIVPTLLARERGWRAHAVARVVVLRDGTTERDAVRRHTATFEAALPARTREVTRWLADPEGAISGLWFVRFTTPGGAPRRTPSHRAVAVRRSVRDSGEPGTRDPIPLARPASSATDHHRGW